MHCCAFLPTPLPPQFILKLSAFWLWDFMKTALTNITNVHKLNYPKAFARSSFYSLCDFCVWWPNLLYGLTSVSLVIILYSSSPPPSLIVYSLPSLCFFLPPYLTLWYYSLGLYLYLSLKFILINLCMLGLRNLIHSTAIVHHDLWTLIQTHVFSYSQSMST